MAACLLHTDTMHTDILIFLDYWDNDSPTRDAQLGFQFAQMDNEADASELGEVYTNEFFYQKNPAEAVREEIERRHPQWVIGLENSATLLMPYRHLKRILINPTISDGDLDGATAETVVNTYAFFSSAYEADYERYTTVYQNAAYYPATRILFIDDVLSAIQAIIAEY